MLWIPSTLHGQPFSCSMASRSKKLPAACCMTSRISITLWLGAALIDSPGCTCPIMQWELTNVMTLSKEPTTSVVVGSLLSEIWLWIHYRNTSTVKVCKILICELDVPLESCREMLKLVLSCILNGGLNLPFAVAASSANHLHTAKSVCLVWLLCMWMCVIAMRSAGVAITRHHKLWNDTVQCLNSVVFNIPCTTLGMGLASAIKFQSGGQRSVNNAVGNGLF